jgi:hypothetical protein
MHIHINDRRNQKLKILEINHVWFMLWRLCQIRAHQGCNDACTAGNRGGCPRASRKFPKERMLQRQADKKRKERLLLLDLYRSYVVKRPPSSVAFCFIELRPRDPRQACRSPFFCRYSLRLTSPRA